MGKPPVIPHDVLKASILERDVVDRNGQVHGTSHPVWKELANFHQNKITDNYAYVYVKTNRHGIYDQILKDKGIKQPSPNSSSEDTGEDFEDGDGDEKEIKRDLKPSTTFQVLISAEKWQKMKPHDTVSKRSERPNPRVRRVLPQFIWQPIVIECLWDQHKLPCPYSFTRGSVFNSDTRDCFIKMAANCNECGAVAEGRILMEPADNEVVPLEWSANDTRGIPHVKKRPLSHNLREDLTKELQGGSAAAWRKLEASKKMQHGDTEPPNLFTQRVLRKAQQQQMDKKYGIVQDSSDPIKNLQDMKIRQPHASSIHQIGLDPFFVHYHTKTQLHVFKKFVILGHVVLAIDATGSLVRKVSNGEGHKSAHIFLYEGVIKASGEQLPVMQMLSARQDANNIAFWINEYLRQGSPIPHEVVLDHSKALINAVVVTFCGCNNLKDYFSRCFYVLQNDASLSDRELDRITPQSYLRLDIAHLIGGAAKWKEWRDESTKRLKLFYMQCLGLLVLENSLGGFQDTFIMVGLIANSQLVGAEVAKSMKTLTDRIQGSEIEISDLVKTEESDDDFDDPEFDPLIDDVDEDVDGYLKKIKEEIASRRCEKGPGELNAYYSPAVLKRFYNLLPDFLLWSGVLVETFQSPTAYGSSARVESDFNQIKNGILSGKKRTVRLDRFVAMHLRHVDGSCHLAEADHNLNIYQKSNETGSDGNEEDEEKSGEGHEEESSSDSDAETPDRGSAEDGGQDTGDKAADKPDRGGDPSKSPFKKRNIRKRRAEDHDDDNDTEHQKSLNESENWRGQAPTPKKSKTAKYLNPFPELSAVMNAKSLEPPKEILLKNGLHIGFCKTSATSHAQLKNTCAFDVLAQLTSSAYIQYEMYRNGLEPYLTGSDFFQTCLSLVEKGAYWQVTCATAKLSPD
ncbi:hypothetical protein FOCC_FOCC013525 [Frankliniella occidentalis]|nr:hypothetical protein FOCC_FOCC013525 [Frankliniella occidentalis]